MLINRDRRHFVLKGERQQAARQPGQFLIQPFRVDLRIALKIPQYRFGTVKGIEQPEQRHIRNSKIGHPCIALPAHPHQTLQTRPQLHHQ